MKFCEIKSPGLYLINKIQQNKLDEEYLLVFDSKRGYNEFIKIFAIVEDKNRRVITDVEWFNEMNDLNISFTRANANIDVIYTSLSKVAKYEVLNYSFIPQLTSQEV